MHEARNRLLQLRQTFGRGGSNALVPLDPLCLPSGLALGVEHGGINGKNLSIKAPFVPRLCGQGLGSKSPLVDIRPPDAPILGDAIGGFKIAYTNTCYTSS